MVFVSQYECPAVFLEDGTKDQTFVANPWGNGGRALSVARSNLHDAFPDSVFPCLLF